MDPNFSLSTSNFDDQLKSKEISDNFTFQMAKGNFLDKDMKNELIQVLAKKEALRLLKKTSLKNISKILEKQLKFDRKVF